MTPGQGSRSFLSKSSQPPSRYPTSYPAGKQKQRLQLAISSKIDEGKKNLERDKERPDRACGRHRNGGGVVSCAVVRASPPLAAAARPLVPAHTVSFTVHETIKPAEAFRATSQRARGQAQGGDGTIMIPPRCSPSALRYKYMYVLPYCPVDTGTTGLWMTSGGSL